MTNIISALGAYRFLKTSVKHLENISLNRLNYFIILMTYPALMLFSKKSPRYNFL